MRPAPSPKGQGDPAADFPQSHLASSSPTRTIIGKATESPHCSSSGLEARLLSASSMEVANGSAASLSRDSLEPPLVSQSPSDNNVVGKSATLELSVSDLDQSQYLIKHAIEEDDHLEHTLEEDHVEEQPPTTTNVGNPFYAPFPLSDIDESSNDGEVGAYLDCSTPMNCISTQVTTDPRSDDLDRPGVQYVAHAGDETDRADVARTEKSPYVPPAWAGLESHDMEPLRIDNGESIRSITIYPQDLPLSPARERMVREIVWEFDMD